MHNIMLRYHIFSCKGEVFLTVNNVGRQYTYPMYLGEVPQQELWDIVNINIGATTMMTRIILPQMQKRKRGAIVTVSSGSELQPLPLMTVYAASKVHYVCMLFKFS
jgi:short-subunit dehydrogenase